MIKKFYLNVFIYLLLMLVADQVFGSALSILHRRVSKGTLGKINYIEDCCDEDILIFGSSRAEYHYNAKMIEDSLGRSCFNCGAAGYGIVLSLGYLEMVLSRYTPKLIILDITPHLDIEEYDNIRFLSRLKARYDNRMIKELFSRVNRIERYKMFSMLYRFNSDYIHNPLALIKTRQGDDIFQNKGFVPQERKIDRIIPLKENIRKVDTLKVHLIEDFVKLSNKRSKVVFTVSPYWNGMDKNRLKCIYEIASEYEIPLFDFSEDIDFYKRDVYFSDYYHMNEKGANKYTSKLLKVLQHYCRIANVR